ncbi:MAG: mercury(II) reductase [Robiginitomaculum sp.]|nr:MAG: mercury(II) reductase [Robiginitomaculum sp.]
MTPSSQKEDQGFDLAVIGAGSAGFSASITAAETGANVALIGHGLIGGTCVNVGCVPSKALIRVAESLHVAKASRRFDGISAQAQLDDWAAVRTQKDALVNELRQAKYEDLLPQYDNVSYRPGRASFGADGGLVVDGTPLRADKIIIATGSHVFVPPINGIRDTPWLDSTAVFALQELPASMIILGGGFIGCEMAQMLSRFGVAVTIACRSRLLPFGEPEISAALQKIFEDEGIKVECALSYEGVRRAAEGVVLSFKRGGETHTLKAQSLALATGRSPNSHDMGLDAAGIKCSPGGAIEIDQYMQTSRPGVYAAGDVTGRDQFVYMAAYGAKLAAKNAFGRQDVYDNAAMPEVTFTDPQIASVGHTEASAEAAGLQTKTSLLPLSAVPRALAARDTRGLIKLIANAADDKLVGAHIMAAEGGDSIQSAALAIKAGMTTTELGATLFPYLTTVEGLKLAAQVFDKDISKLSCCAG